MATFGNALETYRDYLLPGVPSLTARQAEEVFETHSSAYCRKDERERRLRELGTEPHIAAVVCWELTPVPANAVFPGKPSYVGPGPQFRAQREMARAIGKASSSAANPTFVRPSFGDEVDEKADKPPR